MVASRSEGLAATARVHGYLPPAWSAGRGTRRPKTPEGS